MKTFIVWAQGKRFDFVSVKDGHIYDYFNNGGLLFVTKGGKQHAVFSNFALVEQP